MRVGRAHMMGVGRSVWALTLLCWTLSQGPVGENTIIIALSLPWTRKKLPTHPIWSFSSLYSTRWASSGQHRKFHCIMQKCWELTSPQQSWVGSPGLFRSRTCT